MGHVPWTNQVDDEHESSVEAACEVRNNDHGGFCVSQTVAGPATVPGRLLFDIEHMTPD